MRPIERAICFQMMLRVAEIERGGLDALVEQVERMLLAVADRAKDLMAAASHGGQTSGVRLGDGDVAPGRLSLGRLPRGEMRRPRAVSTSRTRSAHACWMAW